MINVLLKDLKLVSANTGTKLSFFVFSFCLIIFGCNRDLSENEDTIDIEHLEVAGHPSNICLVT